MVMLFIKCQQQNNRLCIILIDKPMYPCVVRLKLYLNYKCMYISCFMGYIILKQFIEHCLVTEYSIGFS